MPTCSKKDSTVCHPGGKVYLQHGQRNHWWLPENKRRSVKANFVSYKFIRTGALLGVTSKTLLAIKAWITPPDCIAVQRKEKPCSLSPMLRKVNLRDIKTSDFDHVNFKVTVLKLKYQSQPFHRASMSNSILTKVENISYTSCSVYNPEGCCLVFNGRPH